VTVIVFAAAPRILEFGGLAEWLCYGLAAVHFTMTVATDFEMGFWKVIPMSLHKWVETIVGPVLIAFPWFVSFGIFERVFFVSVGLVIVIVRLLSNYSERSTSSIDVS